MGLDFSVAHPFDGYAKKKKRTSNNATCGVWLQAVDQPQNALKGQQQQQQTHLQPPNIHFGALRLTPQSYAVWTKKKAEYIKDSQKSAVGSRCWSQPFHRSLVLDVEI